jgi:hypothetical protein
MIENPKYFFITIEVVLSKLNGTVPVTCMQIPIFVKNFVEGRYNFVHQFQQFRDSL